MVYQTLKYFIARVGLTVLLMMTLGFLGLFLLHEIALPQVVVNDKEVQWGLLGICAFLSWVGHGLVGEMRVVNGLHKLKDIQLESVEHNKIIKRFDTLFALTWSSCFLPGKGRMFRQQLIQRYADYLLSIGREDHEAMGIYIKAFLQYPHESVFRAPIISILAREISLVSPPAENTHNGSFAQWSDEIDLLLDMLKLDNYKDEAIANLLAGLFLKSQEFSVRSELLFARAVEIACPDVEKIVRFVVPFYLRKERADRVALQFYLRALSYDMESRETMRRMLARAFYEGSWQNTDPELHQHCGQVFSAMNKADQEAVMRSARIKTISSSLKKAELVSREDKASLKKLETQEDVPDTYRKATIEAGHPQPGFDKRVIRALLGLSRYLRLHTIHFKWTVTFILMALFSTALILMYWKEHQQERLPLPDQTREEAQPVQKEVADGSKVYTVQIAAVFTQGQSKKIMDFVRSHGVEGLYVVESPRSAGGKWYKIRFGKFPKKEAAQQVAEDLMEKKIIKNYFVLSIVKKDSSSGN